MTPGEFVNYAVHTHHCEILRGGTAEIIRLHNPKTGGTFNIDRRYPRLFTRVILAGITRLGIPKPDDLEDIDP